MLRCLLWFRFGSILVNVPHKFEKKALFNEIVTKINYILFTDGFVEFNYNLTDFSAWRICPFLIESVEVSNYGSVFIYFCSFITFCLTKFALLLGIYMLRIVLFIGELIPLLIWNSFLSLVIILATKSVLFEITPTTHILLLSIRVIYFSPLLFPSFS